jgi:hypothetical protein
MTTNINNVIASWVIANLLGGVGKRANRRAAGTKKAGESRLVLTNPKERLSLRDPQ